MTDKSSDPVRKKSAGLSAAIFLILFGTPFAGVGLMALVQGIRKLVAGNFYDGLMLSLFGLVFSSAGFGIMFAVISARKKSRETAALTAQFSDQPWKLRADWAAGKIKSTTTAPVKFFLLWSALALALSAPAVWNVPKECRQGNYAILIALLFPLVAFSLLGYTLALWRSRCRFGQCYFELAQIPIPLGGTLDGMIRVGGRLKLEHGLQLTFSCIRRVVSGSGENRSVQEEVLWSEEKVFKNDAPLPETEPGRTGIPIFFQLPEGQPQCFTLGDVSVLWRLEAKAKLRGPDFHAQFELPVFKVGEAAVATTAAADPTAAWQMPIEEIRRDENSKIKITDGSHGREFYFPAARNLGTALMVTLFALILDAVCGATIHFHAPILFPILAGLFGFFLTWAAFNLCFKSSRVMIDTGGVRCTNHYLCFSRTRQFPAADVTRFATKIGMTSGTTVFTDIQLFTRSDESDFAANKAKYQQTRQMPALRLRTFSPGGVTIAGSIASLTEANWLVQEMTKALGRA
jgi:hypothetical protein